MADKRAKELPPRLLTSEEAQIKIAARSWWRSKRPPSWDRMRHMEYPTVNTVTPAERDLALAVCALLKSKLVAD